MDGINGMDGKGNFKSFYKTKYVNNWALLTRTRYTGLVMPSKRTLEGFGMYIYPDGSKYIGNFVNSQFHGMGRLQLSAPYSITFSGKFEMGVLINITDIEFADGLHVDATIDDDNQSLKFYRWQYCTEFDRRFFIEHLYGLQGIGPDKYETANGKGRSLQPNDYDVEEGIYNVNTGLLHNRRPPFNNIPVFVGCRVSSQDCLTSEWIKNNCRSGDDTCTKILPRMHHKIIYNNVKESVGEGFNCNSEVDKKNANCFNNTHDNGPTISTSNETTSSSIDSDFDTGHLVKLKRQLGHQIGTSYIDINFDISNEYNCNEELNVNV